MDLPQGLREPHELEFRDHRLGQVIDEVRRREIQCLVEYASQQALIDALRFHINGEYAGSVIFTIGGGIALKLQLRVEDLKLRAIQAGASIEQHFRLRFEFFFKIRPLVVEPLERQATAGVLEHSFEQWFFETADGHEAVGNDSPPQQGRSIRCQLPHGIHLGTILVIPRVVAQ